MAVMTSTSAFARQRRCQLGLVPPPLSRRSISAGAATTPQRSATTASTTAWTTFPPPRGRNGWSASAMHSPNCRARSDTITFRVPGRSITKSSGTSWRSRSGSTKIRDPSSTIRGFTREYINGSVYLSAEPIDAAQGDEHCQRHRADAADSPRRRRRAREPHPPAARGRGNGHCRRIAARSLSTRAKSSSKSARRRKKRP